MRQRQHALLGHLTTLDSVRDMESIRKALGAPQINYYGFSYGTYLGQVYGTLYPNRLRRVSSTASSNATRVWYKANLDQDIAFNKSVKVFFAYVAAHDSTWHLGNTDAQVELRYYAELKKLIGHPPTARSVRPNGTTSSRRPAYYVYGWVDVGERVRGLGPRRQRRAAGRPVRRPAVRRQRVRRLPRRPCTDAKWPTNWQTWRRDNWSIYAKAPFLTWDNAWFNAPCASGPRRPATR